MTEPHNWLFFAGPLVSKFSADHCHRIAKNLRLMRQLIRHLKSLQTNPLLALSLVRTNSPKCRGETDNEAVLCVLESERR